MRLKALIEHMPVAIAAIFPKEGVTLRNAAWLPLHGFSSFEQLPGPDFCDIMLLLDLHHPDGRLLSANELPHNRVRRGEQFSGFEVRLRRVDVEHERWVSYNGSSITDDDGSITLALLTIQDITERKQAEAQRELMVQELSHRVKNLLSTVQAIARQTAAGRNDVGEFTETFGDRLQALAGACDLLIGSGWRAARLEELARTAIDAYLDQVDQRVLLDIEDLPIRPQAAQNLVLAFHELTTNALKYGALSVPDGRVSLRATRAAAEGGEILDIIWSERDGPEVCQPQRRGFGTTLLSRVIGAQHRGQVTLDWRAEGLVCRFTLPLSEVLGPAFSAGRT